MIRPSRCAVLAATVLASGWIAAGCTTFTDNDDVARVGDASLGLDELASIVPPAQNVGTAATEPRGDVPAEPVRATITNWIVGEVLDDHVRARGGEVTDDDRAEARAALEQSPGFTAESEARQELFVDERAVLNVWSRLPVTEEEMEPFRENYERGAQVSGIACTAHVLVDSEEAAQEVVDEIGGDVERFAEVAEQRSTDEGTAGSGGVIPCTDLSTFAQSYAPEYVAAAAEAAVGDIVGPVQTQFGYHVILVRPFEAVRDDVALFYAADRFEAIAEATDVYVDPRYGEFDGGEISVVPLGGPEPGGVPIPPNA